ncbi:MAG: phytanoyl-CoA dioxygenase family protein [Gammaproteobacteria bacterium]|nr:phytanoyl-CoA dioxygenase family protein [Gammaproteobacteria bacterium]
MNHGSSIKDADAPVNLANLPQELRAPAQEIEALIAQGQFEAGIASMQKLARSSGDPVLMLRLIALRAQGLKQAMQPLELQPMYDASAHLDDPDALQARLSRDGYLFLRDVIPAQALRQLRKQITTILADEGWIEGGDKQDEALAVSRPRREGQRRYFQAHDRIIRLEALHSLAHNNALMALMRNVLGPSVFPHPLSIVRLVFPQSPELATPPHQDYPNNQGTADLTAAWIPLADCPIQQGSLAVLEGSHKFGVLPLKFHLGAGNRRAVLGEQLAGLRWVGADFKLGDVLLFPSLTVHKAMENLSKRNMRLSVDFRFQREGEALTSGCLQPHFERISWEDIYRGWESTRYQYYWQNKNYVEVPWNAALHELPPDHYDEAYEQEMAFNLLFNARSEA